jgi:phosphate transport system substrate-binding protein
MRRIFLSLFLLITLCGCAASNESNSPSEENSVPGAYIQNKGSDTVVNLALAWAERYQTVHPEARISVTGGGTGTGIAALIDGTVDIANASRAMKDQEREEAIANGIDPVEYVIARDAIAVIVHPDNPVKELSLLQIAEIFRGEINNWTEVGGEDRPIVRVSRETNSGTHVYFLESVIRLGSKEDTSIFSADTLLLPSSEGIISEVRDNPNAIGYDGLGYVIPEVKVVAVSKEVGGRYVMPSVETVNSGEYPISRDLYMYTPKDAGEAVKTYLDWIYTPEAQAIVRELGFVPVR